MSAWQIVLLHTERDTMLKRLFEAAFPGQVNSVSVPSLGHSTRPKYSYRVRPNQLVDYFNRQVYDPGIWRDRVLTIYGDGEFHHYTYALSRLAIQRRGLHNFDWTYFHFDQHRDDWGRRRNGWAPRIDCAGFVDQLAHDSRAIPFMVGPDVYPAKDSKGYEIRGTKIPLYHAQFPQSRHSKRWKSDHNFYSDARELADRRDLEATPTESYTSFDLDLLGYSEIVTNFDQNEKMALRHLLRHVDHVRQYKRIFSADILGFPDECEHPLSVLTMIILAKKIMGQGIKRLYRFHAKAKKRQANWVRRKQIDLLDTERKAPITEGELLEILKA